MMRIHTEKLSLHGGPCIQLSESESQREHCTGLRQARAET